MLNGKSHFSQSKLNQLTLCKSTMKICPSVSDEGNKAYKFGHLVHTWKFPEQEQNVYFSSTVCVKPHKDFFKCHPSSLYIYIKFATNPRYCSFTNLLDHPWHVPINKTHSVVKEKTHESKVYVETLKCLRHKLHLNLMWF